MTQSTAPAADLTLDEAGALAPLEHAGVALARVKSGAVLIDVRGAENIARDGAVDGAIPVDRYNLEAEFGLDSPNRHPAVVDHDTPIVVVCGSVRGSGPVARELIAQGFTNVVHVEGGVASWHEAAGTPQSGDGDGATCSV
ncbi:rhodanese-like domain-containing protein [Subtercola frigoramans]|uniref:Rhodanese-related sulfurtransferase n=1 Tax=Subtercola frigoramans TaxID=120298 RepID=A0ABS2L8P1_9MICO|nr:rhodanese-like domain-containing protein [Subtercola frigoramans]MBM7473462.1 rhodanese-related sulfurtransferase [Subtercola frigoramans]